MIFHTLKYIPIKGGLDFIEEYLSESGTPDPDQVISKAIGDMRHSTQSAIYSLNDFLDFDSAQSGKLKLDKVKLNAATIFASYIRLNNIYALKKSINLTFINNLREFRNVVVNIDKFKMEQVMRNLIINAVKFTPKGGMIEVSASLEVVVDTSRDSSAGLTDVNKKSIPQYNSLLSKSNKVYIESVEVTEGYNINNQVQDTIVSSCRNILRIEVKDNGIGLSEDNLKNLFNEYTQFDAKTTQSGGGSGLGLWVCREIIRLHGSEIIATSNGIGTGTTFSFCLELESVQPADLSESLQSSPSIVNDIKSDIIKEPKEKVFIFYIYLNLLLIVLKYRFNRKTASMKLKL